MVGGADAFWFPHFLDGATSSPCRRILTVHDLSYERFPEFFSFGRRLWHHVQMRPRRQMDTADRILAVSDSTRRDILRLYGISGQKVTTIYSGIDLRLHRALPEEIDQFRRRHNLPDRFVLALGTREPRKNLSGLIAAMRAGDAGLRDTLLVLAGSDGWLEDARELSGEGIRRVGPIEPSQRAQWLSAASVVAYPSFFEGFGFPPLEAMACGTPALVGANSSMLQACGDAALAVNPYSIGQIAHGLTALLDDTQLRDRLIRRGYERVRQFSWRKAAEQTLDAIFSTLSRA
jgi:glycosyltransferase involved in cell wall biosynthesis